ncbi:hypothetical protein RFI_18263 [Reticulomyxa filosa]|uniref:SAP domain-containing protein n=1 Tax=Reticulomyxa filosa TaxID=46433 RepID=X6MY79_RETFI|nr:hypothetical protein RFI_18263 [Reticulomyxa filosa]|eukprot:ETO18975.1 hypothetical protein RFI_18263 [Reticulomyxa filosa]
MTDEEDQKTNAGSSISKNKAKNQNVVPETPHTQSGLKKLRVADLKPKLKKRGLTTTGIKEVLVNRLFDHINKYENGPVKKKENVAQATNNQELKKSTKNNNANKEDTIYWRGKPTRESKGKIYYKKVLINGVKYRQYDKCQIKGLDNKLWVMQLLYSFFIFLMYTLLLQC